MLQCAWCLLEVRTVLPCLFQGITPWAALFFVITIVIGCFMVLQLFLAILLSGLDAVSCCFVH